MVGVPALTKWDSGPSAPDWLAFALSYFQAGDDARAKQKYNQRRGNQCRAGSKRDVPEDIENGNVRR